MMAAIFMRRTEAISLRLLALVIVVVLGAVLTGVGNAI